MINLLPPQQKQEIEQIRYRNLIFNLEILLLFFLISFIFVIFIVKILIESEFNILKNKTEAKEKEMVLYEPLEKKQKILTPLFLTFTLFIKINKILQRLLKKFPKLFRRAFILNVLIFLSSKIKKNPF